MERKLAAILAADVAGYSRLMGIDEEGTLNALRAHRDVVDGLIVAHRGRVFHSAGDSVVAEFPSAVEAINCAVEIQQEMDERNEPVPMDKRLQFRIGINIGDVMTESGDLFGDGVNVAARVQGLAEPGGICVTRNVYNQVRHKVGVVFESLGHHHVKNIAEPVSVYRVLIEGTARRRVATWLALVHRPGLSIAAALVLLLAAGVGAAWHFYPRAEVPTRMPSLAVLPFNNLSGSPELEYFSDGVSEDIITMLSRFPDIAVIARNSSFTYKGKAVDVRQVSKELGVEYVLEGSVRKDADKIRIVAQLIDARTGQHVWAERYDNEGSDPWVLQDEVTAKIIGSLAGETGQIRQAEYKRAWGKDTANLEEYDYYLRGHEIFMRFESKETNDLAGKIWQEGLDKFPNSSLLRVKLGWFYFVRAFVFWSDDTAADYRRAGELAREALSGQNLSPQTRRVGHWLMAYVHSQEGDFERAVADADATIALAPYDAFLLGDLALVHITAGNPRKALDWVEIASRRDPQNQQFYNWRRGWAYYVQGDCERSIGSMKDAAGMDPHLFLASCYVRLDRMDDARAEVKKALEMESKMTQAKWRKGWFYHDPAILERQLADLGKAGLPEK